MDGGTLGLNLLRRRRDGAARAGVRRDRLRPCARHAAGAARRRSAGVGRTQDVAAPDRLQRRAGAGAAARPRARARSSRSACSRSTLDDFGGSLTAPVRARLARGRAAAPRGELAAWGYAGTPRPPDDARRAAERGVARARTPTKSGRPSADDACRDRRSAPARARARARGRLTMCIGIPHAGHRVRRSSSPSAKAAAGASGSTSCWSATQPVGHLGAGLPGHGGARADRRTRRADTRGARRARSRRWPATATSTRYFADLVDARTDTAAAPRRHADG